MTARKEIGHLKMSLLVSMLILSKRV